MTAAPSQTWRMLASDGVAVPERAIMRGADAAAIAIAGVVKRKRMNTAMFLREADAVLAYENQYQTMSDAALDEVINELRALIRRGRDTIEDRRRAFAVVREAGRRELGMSAFRVQIAGGMAIHAGCIAEMATGEGKTLTASMPAAVAAWRGRGCHVFTANDYLATRDARTLAPVYRRLGLSVEAVNGEMGLRDRRSAYAADVTYCTSKDAAADYLRDRLALGRLRGLTSALIESIARPTRDQSGSSTRLLQRGLANAIVDEADFVLIDEAVTPLIVSEASAGAAKPESFVLADRIAAALTEGEHFSVDRMHREIELTSAGRYVVETASGEGIGVEWSVRRRREEMVVMALNARHLYTRDADYIVRHDEIVIVDESTGRLMPDRTWRDGLHQAVEAKEGLTVREVKETRARISFQKFFRMYRHIGGMSGTVAEASAELWSVYRTPVVRIPTNKPIARETWEPRLFASAKEKWQAVADEVVSVRATGRPVLVGTRTVGESEYLSAMLRAVGIDHEVLNAVRHREEASIVAGAGHPWRVTVATNMAGRGTDIMLAAPAREAGGLHVIATTRHESARIDRQLAGRAGRQGDPGSVREFVSLEDELPVRYTPMLSKVLRTRGLSQGPSIRLAWSVLKLAQYKAARHARAMRASVLRGDEWLEEWLGFAGKE